MDRLENKKIGLFGGTFDPIHYGHLIVAEKAREEFSLDYIIFIPAGIPPHKKKVYASPSDRFKMIEIAISDNPYFKVSDIEIFKKEKCYTYDTLMKLKRENPKAEFFLIIGEDSLYDIPNWYKAEKLVKEIVFLVAKRSERESFNINFPVKYKIIHSPFVDISSTHIRNCIFENKTVKYLVPDRVLEYIKRESIYVKRDF
ncbi:MAG: nicotinate-nucleotide adenylyltransferase [Candidatus Ratteibacteria bacterium]